MLYNVWTPIKKPLNNRERAARDEAEKLKRSTPQPIPGRHGWFICDGKQIYDPTKDPGWAADILRRDQAEQAKKAKAAAEVRTDEQYDAEDHSLWQEQMQEYHAGLL